MTDIDIARKLLYTDSLTCVLCRGEAVYTSDKRGILPMMTFIRDGYDLFGFSVADKVVGKATAMLFVKAGISEVFADVMSDKAVDILKMNNIACHCTVQTECIINRRGDGPCPMESAVQDVDDTDVDGAYECILNKLHEMDLM